MSSPFKAVSIEQIEETLALAMKNLLGTDKDIVCSIKAIEYGKWDDSVSFSSMDFRQKTEGNFLSLTEQNKDEPV